MPRASALEVQHTAKAGRPTTSQIALLTAPRVLLADDQDEMLATIMETLEGECEIIATVHDGRSALELGQTLFPDILVLDISMPVLNGIEAASRLRDSGSDAKVIFLTVHDDHDFVRAAISVGARGYVVKPSLANDLIPAIREVLKGKTFFSAAIHFQR